MPATATTSGSRGRTGARAGEIADFDPAWPAVYDTVADRIRAALGDASLALDHVGSTAVPGLAAKPVIDVDLTVADSATRRRTCQTWRRSDSSYDPRAGLARAPSPAR